MKKVFLLMLALASIVNADDVAMNCTQQGFQIGGHVGWGLTTPSNSVYNFSGPTETADSIASGLSENFDLTGVESGKAKIVNSGLNYSNISSWQSDSAIIVGLNMGYKWLLNCNQYSVTATTFIEYNGASMTSGLNYDMQNFEVQSVDEVNEVVGSVATNTEAADDLILSSGPVFGFRFLLAKEFNWGNAGLVLGMKFNSYKLKYLQANEQVVQQGACTTSAVGNMDVADNGEIDLYIDNYLDYSSKTQVATGFTIGFATNYYISDNLSAGFTVFYDMYAPVTFNLENIAINPYVFEEGGEQQTDSGKIKFQNNTIGVMMNLTYSFGAN